MSLTVKQKLIGTLAAMTAVLLVVSAIGWILIGHSQEAAQNLQEEAEMLHSLGNLSRDMVEAQANVVAFVAATNNADFRRQIGQRIATLDEEISRGLDELSTSAESPLEQSKVTALREAWTTYRSSRERTLGFVRGGDLVAAEQNMTGDAAQKFQVLLQTVEEFAGLLEQEVGTARTETQAQLTIVRFATLGAGALSIVVLILGMIILRPVLRAVASIARTSEQLAERELAALEGALERLAAGDLTGQFAVTAQPLAMQGRDELARTVQAFNRMLERLQRVSLAYGRALGGLTELLGQVRTAVKQVNQAGLQTRDQAAQIAEATQAVARTVQSVAQGSASQAEQVSTATTAVEEMGQTIQAVAKAAQEQGRALQRAAELTEQVTERNRSASESARGVAEKANQNLEQAVMGNKVVERTVAAMQQVQALVEQTARAIHELGERSQHIGQIVAVINDVTEQTNLLALNAAIEAARAGEAGKGFAVVAEEVRKLAERSASSTQEIAQMIHEIQRTVEQAVTAMRQSAGAVSEVSSEAREVARTFEGIRRAAEEVAEQNQNLLRLLEEIAQRSNELRTTMEDTAAIAEENAASASELAATASQVRTSIREVTSAAEQNAAAAEEMSAATEEMSTQIGEITAAATHLLALASQLTQLVERFHIASSSDGAVEYVRPVAARALSAEDGWSRTFAHQPGQPSGGNGYHETRQIVR